MGRKRAGQSTAEYAVVIAVVVGAIVAMQIYVKRSMQGKLKDASDFFTSQAGAKTTTLKQYEPYYASSDFTTTTTRDADEEFKKGGQAERTGIKEETERVGTSIVGASAPQ